MLEKKRIAEFQEFNEKRFTKKDLLNSETATVFVLNFLPGQEMPAHKHPGHELSFLVLEGEGVLGCGEEFSAVSAGDAITCSGENMLSFRNTGEERTSVYVVMNKV